MALAGKDLGKDVGQWFGPSTAAGAIKYVLSTLPIFLAISPLPSHYSIEVLPFVLPFVYAVSLNVQLTTYSMKPCFWLPSGPLCTLSQRLASACLLLLMALSMRRMFSLLLMFHRTCIDIPAQEHHQIALDGDEACNHSTCCRRYGVRGPSSCSLAFAWESMV